MRWNITSQKTVLEVVPFRVEEVNLTDKDDKSIQTSFYRLCCPGWVNVLPVTTDNQAILIKQSRIGLLSTALETPGGVVEPGENDLTKAALRELEEETGFYSQRLLPLGSIPANPATHDNLVHYFLALNCQPQTNQQHFPDMHEDISVVLYPIDELEHLVRTGQIKSSYSALCIMLAQKYLHR